MDASPKTPDPEYTIIEKSSLVMEVRRRFGREKFEEDLRIFLRVPEKTFRSFLNSKLDLVNALIIKLKGDPNFSQELQKFLEFGDQTENLGKELEETRKKTSEKAQKVLQKTVPPAQLEKKVEKKEKPTPDPEQIKNKETLKSADEKLQFLKDIGDQGQPKEGVFLYDLIKKILKKRDDAKPSVTPSGYLTRMWEVLGKETSKPKAVSPREYIEHLQNSNMKVQSTRQFVTIERRAKDLGIRCEKFDENAEEEFPSKLIFMRTKDSYCLVIDPSKLSIQWERS